MAEGSNAIIQGQAVEEEAVDTSDGELEEEEHNIDSLEDSDSDQCGENDIDRVPQDTLRSLGIIY